MDVPHLNLVSPDKRMMLEFLQDATFIFDIAWWNDRTPRHDESIIILIFA